MFVSNLVWHHVSLLERHYFLYRDAIGGALYTKAIEWGKDNGEIQLSWISSRAVTGSFLSYAGVG